MRAPTRDAPAAPLTRFATLALAGRDVRLEYA